jgi:integrase
LEEAIMSARETAELLLLVGRLVQTEGYDGELSPAQWMALRFFARANGFSRTPSAFAEFQATTRGIASQAIKALEAVGYLVRQRSQADGRSVSLRLTSKGKKAIARDPFEAAGIPTEPKVLGTRWLDEDEFVQLYRWLEYPDTDVHPPYTRAVRILMLTGQRVEEIARLHVDQWDAKERIIDWSKTKNGRPHAIPLPDLAVDLLGSIIPNKFGWFFPSAKDPSRPVEAATLYSFMWRQRERGVIPFVTNRDLRRTWKTLAGKAGVSKEIRDRIQNHAPQDVSSKSYDRWTYMPEKRAGMDNARSSCVRPRDWLLQRPLVLAQNSI